jgi:cytochrome c553
MFNSNGSICAGIALVVLLSSAAVLAENDKPAAQPPSSQVPAQESAQKQSANEIPGDEMKLRIGPGDPIAGKGKAEMCFGCHGEDGNSTDPQFPKLAGQYGIYIAKQIRNFQSTTRTHQIMSGMAAAVSDDDLADISAYYASQTMMKGDHPSSNKIGKNLFENDDLSRMMVRCSNCHGATGKGQNPGNPVYPVIGGQHKEYLLAQLINFRKGARNNSPGGVMNITVHRLSDAELEALADYVSGL